MNKKLLVLSLFVFLSALALVSAECCERTVDGAWCQNADASECDSDYRDVATSCEETSYCTLGTCIDQSEGICMPNTPRRVCEDAGGFWEEAEVSELPQCSYGCCQYADQAAFVTQSRCGTLGSIFNLNTTYRPDITNELQCLASSRESVKGACVVVRSDEVRNCKMLTKNECNDLAGTSGDANVRFHEGYLCSAEFLGTVCQPRGGTTCVEDSSEVYFKDTCGNIANIYDASRLNDPTYWERIIEKSESCGYEDEDGNANSASCGNCEYLLGSTCEAYERGENTRPTYGDFVCADLSCEYNGRTYSHGEKWCETSSTISSDEVIDRVFSSSSFGVSGVSTFYNPTQASESLGFGNYLPGEESYVMKCYNGRVLQESCSTGNWRNQICVEEEQNGISFATCKANLWDDCLEQLSEEACSDYELRDCRWVEGYSVYRDSDGNPMTVDESGKKVEATCVPNYSPAGDFWVGDSENSEICGLATRTTIVEYKFPLLADRKAMDGNNPGDQKERLEYCEENCEALEVHPGHDEWMDNMNQICASLGDCSATPNYLGYEGYYNPEDLLIQKFVRKAKNTEDAIEDVEEASA